MVQMTTIQPEDQESVLSSFWTMLQECENKVIIDAAGNPNDVLMKLWVGQWYEQWNKITGDTKRPKWEC